MTKHTAEVLVAQGKIIGARLGDAIDALGVGSRQAGPGMSLRDDHELFETSLDAFIDAASFKLYTDAARDLIIAEARLEFYGLHASKADRAKWINRRDEAYALVATKEAA